MILAAFNRLIHYAAGIIDNEAPANGAPPRTLWPFMGWCLRGSSPVIIIGATVSVLGSLTEVTTMYLLGRVVDVASGTGPVIADNLGLILFGAFLLLIARPILYGGLALTQSVMIGPNVLKLTLTRLHRWTLGQAVTFFDNDFAGRIAQKQMQAANSLTEVVVESVNAVVFGAAAVVGTAVLLGGLDPRFASLLGGWLVIYLGFLWIMLPKVRTRAAARAEAKAMVTGQIVDTVTNIKTVKLFAGQEYENRQALTAMSELRDRTVDFGEVATGFRLGLIFLAGILPVVMVGTALQLRGDGISPGDIAAIGAMTIRISQMTGWISFTIMVIYGHLGEVEDGMRTLTPEYELTDAADASPVGPGAPGINFRDVTFAYGREIGGIWDVNLNIAPGEKVGLVGASGAGKSTLVSLMLRLYDTESGSVEIAGQDVRRVTQDSLRNQIGMVTQETAMFNRSARDNVAYGRPDATDAQVADAAKRAEAHEFIQDLEDHKGRRGYDAHLGERGVKLSGGQRQRIALARAILKDAPILLLDEATSALDSEVEAQIQMALQDVMDGKTVIAIAHRLSTIARMDRIVVLDAGRIAEEGTHNELIARGGLYAAFWARQSGGFLGIDQAAE